MGLWWCALINLHFFEILVPDRLKFFVRQFLGVVMLVIYLEIAASEKSPNSF